MDITYSLSFWAKYACVDSAVLHAALRLGLFDHLPVEGEEGYSLSQLAEQINSSVQGTRVIGELLISSRVLAKDEKGKLSIRQKLSSLLRDPVFIGQCQEASLWWGPAQQLPTAVRTGEEVLFDGQTWDLLGRYRKLFLNKSTTNVHSGEAAKLFDRVACHFLRTQVLICTAELGLFSHFNEAPLSLVELAEVNSAEPVGMRVLLDTLVQLGLLESHNDVYRYRPIVQKVLSQRSLASYSEGLHITNMFWQALQRLDATVRYNQRSLDLHDPEQSGRFYLALARYNTGIFPSYFQLIRSLPVTLNRDGALVNAAILDVGAGSGIWGAVFAHVEPTVRVTYLDQVQVLPQTRRNIERLSLGDQASFWVGDLLQVSYGEACYDVIILGQICHTQYPHILPGLFKKLVRALRPGGYLIVADYVLNEQRDGPIDYLYFAVREFVSTQGGILSLPEYVDLLHNAGLKSTRCYRLLGIDVIVAREEGTTLPELLI